MSRGNGETKESAGSIDASNGVAAGAGLRGKATNGAQAFSYGAQRSSSSGGYGNGGRLSASSAGSYGPSSSPFGFSTQSPTENFGGFGLGQFGVSTSKPASAFSKPKLNGGSVTPIGNNGQAVMSMSFNYGPASTSYSSGTGLSTGASSNRAPKAPKANGKPKNGAISSQNRGGYGSTFSDNNQATGAVQVDRVGNGVAYKMMTFTMGSDAMKQNKQQGALSPSSSTRSGYGSSRPSSLGYSAGTTNGFRRANLFAASTAPSVQLSNRRRAAPSARPELTNAALVEDELDNGEINVNFFEEEPAAAATGGAIFASTPSASFAAKPKSATSAGYRGQLGRTRNSYKRAA